MAPKEPITTEDAKVAATLITMAASGRMLDEHGEEIVNLAHALWPKNIHRDALRYGPEAVRMVCIAFGIDAEQVATIAQRMVETN